MPRHPNFATLTSNQALKPHRKPLQKSKSQKTEIFPAASEFIGAYGDHFFGGGVGLERREKVLPYRIFYSSPCLAVSPPEQSRQERDGGSVEIK